jgi:hypothetical protein
MIWDKSCRTIHRHMSGEHRLVDASQLLLDDRRYHTAALRGIACGQSLRRALIQVRKCSKREPLASSGFCHRAKAAALPLHSNQRGAGGQPRRNPVVHPVCAVRFARCHPYDGLRAEQFLHRGRNLQEPSILAIARRQHQTDRQTVAARQRQRDSTKIEVVDDRGIA